MEEMSLTELLEAYKDTQRHIEELERIGATSEKIVSTVSAEKRAKVLLDELIGRGLPESGSAMGAFLHGYNKAAGR